MGFNRRKLEADREAKAEAEAAARRATDAQVLEDAERLNRCLERASGQADAHAFLADDRRRHCRGVLVPVGALRSLPNDERRRPADNRLSSQCGRDQPYSCALLPLVPAERPVCRACAAVPDEYRRRNVRGASPAGAGRVKLYGTLSTLNDPFWGSPPPIDLLGF